MDPEKITYFGETDSRSKRVKFGIKAKDRTRHIYVIGKTGMGKSTLLENMAIQDIQNGEGMAFMDPHGKTAELLLNYVPPERLDDVVYFAPFDVENPISFNVLEDIGADKRHLVVAGLMSTFKKIWVDAWSARMEYILTNALLALIEYPGATLLGVNRLLADKDYRKKVVDNVKDVSVKSFWVDEFAKYTERQAAEAVPAIQNKIGQFTANPLIRNIVGQPKSSFDIRKLMDDKKIIIINLSKGRVGEANANLLGSMMITKIYLAAMSRADVSEKNLKNLPNFYLYVDEFQSFANESFADILSEARKYKLNLTIAHQYIEQMSEEVRAAVFGNVGTMITFRVGAFDAEVLEKEFAPQFTAEDLVNLGMFQMYLKLMINGVSSVPFSSSSLPPYPEPVISYKSEIIQHSRRNFSKTRDEVEEIIKQWIEEAKSSMKVVVKTYASGPTKFTPAQAPKVNIEKAEVKNIIPSKVDIKVEPKITVAPIAREVKVEVPVKQEEPKRVIAEKPKYKKEFPAMEAEDDDDFLPLKELAKKLVIEPKGEEKVPEEEVVEKPAPKPVLSQNRVRTEGANVKTMSPENLSDLRSVLASVMKKSETVSPKLKEEPKVEEMVEIKAEPKVEAKPEPIVEVKKPEPEIKAEVKEDIKPISENEGPKEISEEELNKILGL